MTAARLDGDRPAAGTTIRRLAAYRPVASEASIAGGMGVASALFVAGPAIDKAGATIAVRALQSTRRASKGVSVVARLVILECLMEMKEWDMDKKSLRRQIVTGGLCEDQEQYYPEKFTMLKKNIN